MFGKIIFNIHNSSVLAVLTSVFLVCVVFLNTFFFDYSSINVYGLVVLILSVSLFTFIFVRWLVDTFIYNKIKLIYKNISANKAKPGYLAGVDLNQVDEDVSEWNENIENEIEKLEIRESYRRQFVGNVAHELKTPIFNIQGYIDTLLDGALEDSKINRKFLERANKSVSRMIYIVEDLDAITKLEGGKIEIEEEPVDVIELILDVVDQLEMKAKKRNVNIVIEDPRLSRYMVEADVEKIKQVLINLMVNAIKYGNEGGEVLVRTFDMDQSVLVEVADNGNGIPQKHLSKIFERFYRVDKSRDREQGGSGLGLSIVKHIIEAHNQSINVRSTIGTGSTFSFTLKKANTN
jgi:two-component system, OmpR family, phosphate regulon sensor histidine kinase PhoR